MLMLVINKHVKGAAVADKASYKHNVLLPADL
jgi:hypothetical protein